MQQMQAGQGVETITKLTAFKNDLNRLVSKSRWPKENVFKIPFQ